MRKRDRLAFEGGSSALSRSLGLTPRETDVLQLVASRYGNAEIAERLGISKRTVESHMAALLRKLDVPDRAALGRALRAAAPAHARVDADERRRIRLAAAQARAEAKEQRTVAHDAVRQLVATVAKQRIAAEQLDSLSSRLQPNDPQEDAAAVSKGSDPPASIGV